jgi:GntR family transcriptional repressor for pyruvate dehydrogenase complex
MYQRLAATISDRIRTGDLKVGERLPSENVLAAQAGVSRSTVREALRLLQESGFLERSSPRILVVRGQSDAPAVRATTHALRRRTVTFAALHESLLLLEPALTAKAAQRRDDDDLQALRNIIDAQHAKLGDYAEWCRLEEEFHLAIAEASSNAPLTLARLTLAEVLMPTILEFVTDERATRAGTEWHERIYAEILKGDGEFAAVLARRHIDDWRDAWERSGRDYHRDISELINAASGRLPRPGRAGDTPN